MNLRSRLFQTALYSITGCTLSLLVLIIGYIITESMDFFHTISFFRFITGSVWDPLYQSSFEILPVILGTLVISVLAVIVSLPISIGAALFLCRYLKGRKKYIAAACIDSLAGIPSVIVGFIGMLAVITYMEALFDLSAGESVLAGVIVLAFMLLPYEVSSIMETLDILKHRYESCCHALGMDSLYALIYVILPAAKGAVLSAATLALARGIGETMAVMMVIGNANLMPRLLGKAETIAARIALEMGMAEVGSTHYQALFAAAGILIAIVLLLNAANMFIQRFFIQKQSSMTYEKIN